jgi:hypothetical protein
MTPGAFDRRALEAHGFEGWVLFRDLPASKVPAVGGVYIVYRNEVGPPNFLERSPAGHFKQTDPTVPTSVLERKWITAANVMNIGMASKDLRGRLNTYRRFGEGAAVGHKGGRYLWQLADANHLLVAWKTESDAATEEASLLRRFIGEYGALPFANLNAGRTLPPKSVAAAAPATRPRSAQQGSTTFMIAGRAVTLSAEDVREALRGVLPESVHVWAVDVDGRMYPVVQALERASGVPREATRSARARSVLGSLGFRLIRL